MPTMKVTASMDGLRRNMANDYSNLVLYLNDALADDAELDREELAKLLLELRQDIGVLHCVYLEGVDQFSDLSGETGKIAKITFCDAES